MKNAFLGGALCGFSSSAEGQRRVNITPFGAISIKKKGAVHMAQEGLLGGTGTAAEKLADYHIKLAENISSVILVLGGTKVDVMFTRSVQIGEMDPHDRIGDFRDKRDIKK